MTSRTPSPCSMKPISPFCAVPRKCCHWLLADKGYDAEALRRYCDRYRMQPIVPLRSMKRKPKPGLPRLLDRPKYRKGNIIERMFGRAEREPPHRHSLRQACEKLRSDGLASLRYAMFATLLFVQCLAKRRLIQAHLKKRIGLFTDARLRVSVLHGTLPRTEASRSRHGQSMQSLKIKKIYPYCIHENSPQSTAKIPL